MTDLDVLKSWGWTENPTLAIHFPWQKAPMLVCLNCNERVSNSFARRHALIDRDTDGCGVEFKYVTTSASEVYWQEYVAQLRDDLEYRPTDWAAEWT